VVCVCESKAHKLPAMPDPRHCSTLLTGTMNYVLPTQRAECDMLHTAHELRAHLTARCGSGPER
jgi:hypothetical protein